MANKKGQAALEYLLTYGWAILIVIIVGASLYALGVFTPGQWTGRRHSGFAQFRITDFKFDTDGDLTILFQNQIGKPVRLENVTANFRDSVKFNDSTLTVSPNQVYTRTINITSSAEIRSSYNIQVDFYYTDLESNLLHIDSGTLFGAVEPTG